MYGVERYHDISAGHRVVGHENKCRYLHGHNYRIFFTCVPDSEATEHGYNGLDDLGRVIDFSVIKATLCEWLENNWDHKMLLWDQDPIVDHVGIRDSVVTVPFNPTAENMARYLVERVGANLLVGTGVVLHSVRVEETRKCSATYTRSHG